MRTNKINIPLTGGVSSAPVAVTLEHAGVVEREAAFVASEALLPNVGALVSCTGMEGQDPCRA